MSQESTATKAKRILVVDDDPDVVMMLAAMLKGEGYEVDTASSGKECLEKISVRLPDAIILDIMMPGLNGGQAARLIKTNPKTENIPILFLTGLTDKKIMKAALFELGVEYYLTKPYDAVDLLDKVGQAIRYKVDPQLRA